MDDVNNVGMSC